MQDHITNLHNLSNKEHRVALPFERLLMARRNLNCLNCGSTDIQFGDAFGVCSTYASKDFIRAVHILRVESPALSR